MESSKPSVKVSQEVVHKAIGEAKVRIREFDPFDPIYLQEGGRDLKSSLALPAQMEQTETLQENLEQNQ